MGGAGIIWATIICIPFAFIVILAIKGGIIAMQTIIFVGLILSALLLFLILSTAGNTKKDGENKQLFSPATRVRPFYNMKTEFKLADNGGTRAGIDRRKFEYTAYIPEKRSGKDRRKGSDRRSEITRKTRSERKNSIYHRGLYPMERRDIFRTQS